MSTHLPPEPPKTESAGLRSLTPATRAALIVGGFFAAMLLMTGLWVGKEASRIRKQRNEARAAADPRSGDMVLVPAGSFTMGGIGEEALSDELPLHDVKVSAFYMDRTEVTNEEFQRFVTATGYVTVAERPLSAATRPGLPPELEGKSASLLFQKPQHGEKITTPYQGWALVSGASWRSPSGPGSDLKGLEKHPVVHVCQEDALAYCKWAGKRLPTEAEWEYAARGGLVAKPFIWGSDFRPDGKPMANTWQGEFPNEQKVDDGYAGTAPVGCFPPNGYGLLDMAGNVWEMTADWYRPDTYSILARNPDRIVRRDPKGPAKDDSFDPEEPGVPKIVTRGGSFMCAENYCRGYRPSARMRIAAGTALQNTGFRCVKDAPKP